MPRLQQSIAEATPLDDDGSPVGRKTYALDAGKEYAIVCDRDGVPGSHTEYCRIQIGDIIWRVERAALESATAQQSSGAKRSEKRLGEVARRAYKWLTSRSSSKTERWEAFCEAYGALWGLLGFLLVIGFVVGLPLWMIEKWKEFPPGARCHIVQPAIGTVERKIWEDVAEAVRLKDDLGLQQLRDEQMVVRLESETKLLVLDWGVNSLLHVLRHHRMVGLFSRKVRVLDGEHAGKALWINDCFMTGRVQ